MTLTETAASKKKGNRYFGTPSTCPECGAKAYHAQWGCTACGDGNPFKGIRCLTTLVARAAAAQEQRNG